MIYYIICSLFKYRKKCLGYSASLLLYAAISLFFYSRTFSARQEEISFPVNTHAPAPYHLICFTQADAPVDLPVPSVRALKPLSILNLGFSVPLTVPEPHSCLQPSAAVPCTSSLCSCGRWVPGFPAGSEGCSAQLPPVGWHHICLPSRHILLCTSVLQCTCCACCSTRENTKKSKSVYLQYTCFCKST